MLAGVGLVLVGVGLVRTRVLKGVDGSWWVLVAVDVPFDVNVD